MSLFRKAANTLFNVSKEIAAQATAPSIPGDLQVLDKVQPGLGQKTYAYIQGSGDGTVLSTLSQTGGRLFAGEQYYPRGTHGIAERRALLCDPDTDIGLITRYVHVLAASNQGRPPRDLHASKAVPVEVQTFLGELVADRPPARPDDAKSVKPNMTYEHVVEIVKALGGSVEDMFEIAFFQDRGFSGGPRAVLITRVDYAALARAYPKAVLAQVDRLDPGAQVKMLHFLITQKLSLEAPFDDMILNALGDSSKGVREVALKGFSRIEPEKRETLAAEFLAKGKVDMRGSMVEVLAKLDSESAGEILKAHLDVEKTARIRAAIEAHLTVTGTAETGADADGEAQTSYRALDGSVVEIPPMRVLEGDINAPFPPLTDAVRTALMEATDRANAAISEDKLKGRYYAKEWQPVDPKTVPGLVEYCLQHKELFRKNISIHDHRLLGHKEVRDALVPFLNDQPLATRLAQGMRWLGGLKRTSGGFGINYTIEELVLDALNSDDLDLRFADRLACDLGLSANSRAGEGAGVVQPGHLIGVFFDRGYHALSRRLELSPSRMWPLIAENLHVVDRAFGFHKDHAGNLFKALELVDCLPAMPAKYGPHVMGLAFESTKEGRKRARASLTRTSGYEPHLVTLLDDSRQDLRAGAAKWLGEKGYADAVAPLKKRVKKEKSQVAKAAMLAALEALGQDISAHVGPEAFQKEADKGLPKANFKDLDWVDFDQMPHVTYKDGSAVPADVLKWWVALAAKLKAPGETALFDLYLDQLRPEDAVTLSTWMFDAWYGFDCGPPTEATVEAAAQREFQRMHGNYWQYIYPHMAEATDAEKMEWLRQRHRQSTPNSGAASKGVLALASKMPPTHGVAKVRTYLKKHGGRTSQTTALLELMAAKGDAMSLQVVIAAATRLRQKGVQAKAKDMIQAVADRNDWSLDELADRTVPTGGLEDDGRMELPCAGGDKIYVAQLDEKLALTLFNPAGKVVKALPAGEDEETKTSKKALSAAKKEIKQAIAFQTNRLFEAMCTGRAWTPEAWQRDFHGHPLMRKLIERLIWQGFDGDGTAVASFRPTPEGDFIDMADADVDPTSFARIGLAHASTLSAEDASAWRAHLKDYEVPQLFEQVREGLPVLTEEMAMKTDLDDRLGYVTDAFTLRGAAQKAGYERGDALDGGGFDCYTRHFGGVGIVAVLQFSGNHVQQDNIPAAYKTMFFERLPMGQSRGYGSGQKLPLSKVPPVMLSECWADLHKISAKASFDPDWEKVCPW